MLHASTSPFYPLLASLDVGAQMMKGRNGFHLWNDATRLAIDTRKTIRKIRREFEARAGDGSSPPWFFDPFVPDVVTVNGSPHTPDLREVPWEDVPTEVLHKALTKAAKVVKRTVEATTDEITSELQEALKS